MSQGDLAEQLDVSRQSISKWETDGAVPELDKLIRLSKIFGITLDELVHGEASPSQPSPAEQPSAKGETRHKTVALVLLVLAVLCFACCTVFGIPALGLILMMPFLLGGLVSLLCRRHPLLWACWAMLILVDLYLRFATGLSWAATRLTLIWRPEMNYVRLAIAWVQLLCILSMTLATVLTYRKQPLLLEGRARVRYILGWVGLIAIALIMRLPLHQFFTFGFDNFYSLLYGILDYARIILFTIQLTATVRWRTAKKERC